MKKLFHTLPPIIAIINYKYINTRPVSCQAMYAIFAKLVQKGSLECVTYSWPGEEKLCPGGGGGGTWTRSVWCILSTECSNLFHPQLFPHFRGTCSEIIFKRKALHECQLSIIHFYNKSKEKP